MQLPMYNEDQVAERIIRHTCQIDYPLDRLEIQVLDDSTDNPPKPPAEPARNGPHGISDQISSSR